MKIKSNNTINIYINKNKNKSNQKQIGEKCHHSEEPKHIQ